MDLSAKSDLLWLSELVRDLRQAAPAHEPLMVGAMARDLLLHYGSGVRVARATTDVDLGFAVADWDEFDVLRKALIDSRSFTPSPSVNHKLFNRRVAVDLIPFGGVEDAAGRIIWPADESLMSVLGYREARATAVELLLPRGQRIPTVSLPMLAILKVIAWSERHTTHPRKDASDLLLVLRNYLSDKAAADRLYSEAAQLLESEDFDYEVAGAWLAGRDSAEAITATSAEPERLLNAVREVLVAEVNPDGPLHLVGESGSDAQAALRLLQGFLDGLSAGR